jgi:hypothetical protein
MSTKEIDLKTAIGLALDGIEHTQHHCSDEWAKGEHYENKNH